MYLICSRQKQKIASKNRGKLEAIFGNIEVYSHFTEVYSHCVYMYYYDINLHYYLLWISKLEPLKAFRTYNYYK